VFWVIASNALNTKEIFEDILNGTKDISMSPT
jgi:hypothetical protein